VDNLFIINECIAIVSRAKESFLYIVYKIETCVMNVFE